MRWTGHVAVGLCLLLVAAGAAACADPGAQRLEARPVRTTQATTTSQAPRPSTTTTTISSAKDSAPKSRPGGARTVEALHDVSWVATAKLAEVAVYPHPEAAEPIHRLPHPTSEGDPLVFLVVGSNSQDAWLPVYVPVRPNGTQGWVRRSDVVLTPTDYRIKVSRAARTLTVTKGGQVVIQTAVAVGADSTPTPAGRYFVKELIQPYNPFGAYGAFVFGLSAFSENPALENFNGGQGTIGIHGTNDLASIGANVSHGCIRVSNEVITQMADQLPLGAPVEID